MGTINYKTSKYITVGYNLERLEKILNLFEKEGLLEDNHERERVRDYHLYKAHEDATYILNNYDFNFLEVSFAPGYYEGFSIDINFDYLYFTNYEEKNDALKEATQLKKFLLEALGLGLVACSPGWCTTYYDYDTSKKLINEAIKQLKEDIKNTPTSKTYWRARA